MHEITTYEEALRKTQKIGFDDYWNVALIDRRLEEIINMMQKSIHDPSLRNLDLWCTNCMTKGHTKDTCWLKDDRQPDVQIIHTEYYCEICQLITSHHAKDHPYNMKNVKSKWCTIYDENNNNISDCVLNMKNKPNYHKVDHT